MQQAPEGSSPKRRLRNRGLGTNLDGRRNHVAPPAVARSPYHHVIATLACGQFMQPNYPSSFAKRLFRDSARVGCAKITSRRAVYGTFPIMAISIIDMSSPPSTPRAA